MESIYYVATYLCHRTCHHCYEDRFRPYYGDDLRQVVDQSISNHARIIENFPERMTYLDLNDCDPVTGQPKEKTGRVILAGGEIMLDAVREPVLYSALDLLHEKYAGRVDLIVQTTGDLLNEKVLDELLQHHTRHVSVSGIDQHHQGLEIAEARERQVSRLTRLFESRGLSPQPGGDQKQQSIQTSATYFSFFGATEEMWIGPLWPRGRAQINELSRATLADNFCNRWSGALNFLQYRYNGSEVSIDPGGDVFPCCIKTKAPIGNLLHEKLETILDRLVGNPVYEALSMGHPERMGITHGWTIEKFIEASTIRLPSGKVYQNFCLGCDKFHQEVLIPITRRTVAIEKKAQSPAA